MNIYTIFSGPNVVEFVQAKNKQEAIGMFLLKTGYDEGEVDRVACRKRNGNKQHK